MPLYDKQNAEICANCAHFCRHYVQIQPEHYFPLTYGHCVFPRIKDRTDIQRCVHWTPVAPE